MNKNAIKYIVILFLLTYSISMSAQQKAEFKVENLSMQVEKGILTVKMMVISTFTKISSDEGFRLELLLENGIQKNQLPPIVYSGSSRAKFDKRVKVSNGLSKVKPFQTYVGVQKGLPYRTAYSTQLPYESWMDDATIVLKGVLHDCCDEWVICSQYIGVRQYGHLQNLDKKVVPPVVVEPPKPVEKKEVLPQQPVRITVLPKKLDAPGIFVASVRYPKGGNSIFASFSTNPVNLARIDTLINMIADAGNRVQLKSIRIIGYASPEGVYSKNQQLAEGRAGSVKQYMVGQYPRLAEKMKVSGVAEDWEGVVKTLKTRPDFPRRDEIIRMIERTTEYDALEAKLKQMNNGTIFQKLLEEIFPDLRRIELEVEYTLTNYP